MSLAFEDLEVLKRSEAFCDEIWNSVQSWDAFNKSTSSKQIVRSADSIGANLAEGYGRFHWGEKLQFFYYARGSLFETKYWINRAINRKLLEKPHGEQLIIQIDVIGKNINNLIRSTKSQKQAYKSIKESDPYYFNNQNNQLES